MDNLEWLHKHIRGHLSEVPRGQDRRNIDHANHGPAAPYKNGIGALELVEQAADLFARIEDQAREFETRARGIAQGAIEKLQGAEATIQSLRDNNAAAETRIAQLHDELRELAEALKGERARVEAAENQLPQLEMRARSAEAKAEECENTLSRIEEAIRVKILRPRSSAQDRVAA